MFNFVFAGVGLIVLTGLVVEMLTHNIGGQGAVTRFYRTFKLTNIDLVVGFIISSLMIWQGSTFVAILGVVMFIAFAIKAVVRVDARLMEEAEQLSERKER